MYVYDSGCQRKKHKWGENEPGFQDENGRPVAKYPRGFAPDRAEKLLCDGIPSPEEWDPDDGPPKRIYNVDEGVPYVAMRNAPGSVAYHGFPVGYKRLSRSLYRQLRDRACAQERLKEFDRWCKTHQIEC